MVPSFVIAGVRVDDVNSQQTIELVDRFVAERIPRKMIVTNANKTVLAQDDAELLEIMQEADLVTADGMSVVWASRLLGRPLRERVTGIDTMDLLVGHAAEKGFRVYFLGAKREAVESTVRHYLERFPSLVVAGFHDGYFDQQTTTMAEEIRDAKPDLLFVAIGSPAQEKWVARFQPLIAVPFCLGVGGSFDHVAGLSKRAPEIWQRAGFEWLYRLLSEPRRLWKRYLVGNSRFLGLVIKQAIKGQP